MMPSPNTHFDRERDLRELLSGIDRDKLLVGLEALLGGLRLLNSRQEIVLGDPTPQPGGSRAVLRGELEPIGFIEAVHAEQGQLNAAAKLLELLLVSSARYHMVSDLHLEAVHADYQALQQKHAALLESEARYKALAENLELRVAEQVKTIENAQRQLYQAEKLASIGQLAAGVAHEINNPIGFISSNLNSARGYLEKLQGFAGPIKLASATLASAWHQQGMDILLHDFSALVQESAEGAERIARIVADLKGYSNVDHADERLTNINTLIQQVCNVASPSIKEQADVALELADLPDVRCQPGRLGQVFLNLLLNASQAMTARGRIHIQSGMEGRDIVVRISDNGCGIPAHILPRIFDPFFTTKDVGQGTGLGLSASYDIIKAHGGRIAVQSEMGAGSLFTVYLPRRE